MKIFNDISNRQRRRRIAYELLNINHDFNTSKNIQTVSTHSICPVFYNIPVSIKPKNTELIDMFSVSNGINDNNVQNTISSNTPDSLFMNLQVIIFHLLQMFQM